MEIKQLRMFRAVVDAGSISEAARRMNLSQPPLSYHMKMLEQELGVVLFHRGKKSIELTEAGKLLYERAEALLALENTVSREVSATGIQKTLRVGVTPTTAPLLVPALARIHQTEPGLRFEIFDGTTFALREMMEKRLLDCALMRSPVRLDGFAARSLCAEPFMAVGNLEDFCAEGEISLRRLAVFPLILYRRYEAFLHDAFYQKGIAFSVQAVCDDARTALSMAQLGIGVALLPRSMSPLLQNVHSRTVSEKSLETEILFVCRRESAPEPKITALIAQLEKQ